MKTKDAIAYFGSASKLASAIGISRPAVSQWGEYVPPGTAAILEKLTDGALLFDPSVYRHQRGRLWAPGHPHQQAA